LGYLATAAKQAVTGERNKRREIAEALRAGLRARRGRKIPIGLVRHHLALHFAAGFGRLRPAELVRALRDVAATRGRGKDAVVVDVELRKPTPSKSWAERLRAEGLEEELPPVRRMQGLGDATSDHLPEPGQLYRGGDGVLRVATDPELVEGMGEVHDHRRGVRAVRRRRHLAYFSRLRHAAALARLTREQRRIVDMLLQGLRQNEVAKALGRSAVGCFRSRHIARLHRSLGIDGPGRGR
jgi:hypothetical protein